MSSTVSSTPLSAIDTSLKIGGGAPHVTTSGGDASHVTTSGGGAPHVTSPDDDGVERVVTPNSKVVDDISDALRRILELIIGKKEEQKKAQLALGILKSIRGGKQFARAIKPEDMTFDLVVGLILSLVKTITDAFKGRGFTKVLETLVMFLSGIKERPPLLYVVIQHIIKLDLEPDTFTDGYKLGHAGVVGRSSDIEGDTVEEVTAHVTARAPGPVLVMITPEDKKELELAMMQLMFGKIPFINTPEMKKAREKWIERYLATGKMPVQLLLVPNGTILTGLNKVLCTIVGCRIFAGLVESLALPKFWIPSNRATVMMNLAISMRIGYLLAHPNFSKLELEYNSIVDSSVRALELQSEMNVIKQQAQTHVQHSLVNFCVRGSPPEDLGKIEFIFRVLGWHYSDNVDGLVYLRNHTGRDMDGGFLDAVEHNVAFLAINQLHCYFTNSCDLKEFKGKIERGYRITLNDRVFNDILLYFNVDFTNKMVSVTVTSKFGEIQATIDDFIHLLYNFILMTRSKVMTALIDASNHKYGQWRIIRNIVSIQSLVDFINNDMYLLVFRIDSKSCNDADQTLLLPNTIIDIISCTRSLPKTKIMGCDSLTMKTFTFLQASLIDSIGRLEITFDDYKKLIWGIGGLLGVPGTRSFLDFTIKTHLVIELINDVPNREFYVVKNVTGKQSIIFPPVLRQLDSGIHTTHQLDPKSETNESNITIIDLVPLFTVSTSTAASISTTASTSTVDDDDEDDDDQKIHEAIQARNYAELKATQALCESQLSAFIRTLNSKRDRINFLKKFYEDPSEARYQSLRATCSNKLRDYLTFQEVTELVGPEDDVTLTF